MTGKTDEGFSFIKTPLPIYLSRYTPLNQLPKPYGAFINWGIGERVRLINETSAKVVYGTIESRTTAHKEAPIINGARGEGRWCREIRTEDDGQLHCISEGVIHFL